MRSFFLLQAPSGRTYQYACKDISLAGIQEEICSSCGRFEWNRQRLYPLYLDEETWDGSDICRVESIPGYIVCTERVVDLVKRQKLKGFSFKACP